MKKVIAAAGLAVLSTVAVRAQYSPGLTPLETSKPWSLSASVRGFYDDNYLTLPKSYPTLTGGEGHPLGSWGTEVSPAVAVNHSDETTLAQASYLFDYQWYAESHLSDLSHQFKGALQHEFTDRYKLSLNDTFVVAQEPNVVDPVIQATPLRVDGNNIHNTGQVDFTASLTKLFDLHLGYANSVYAYQQITRSVIGYPFDVGTESLNPAVPSYSDLLDRMEQLVTVDLKWKATPETTGVLGYQYGHTAYTSPGYIIYPYSGSVYTENAYYEPPSPGAGSPGYRSDVRNSDSHFVFVGADESFTQSLNGSIRVGAEYLDYYNYDTSRVSPYVDASLTDQYLPGDSAQLGVKHIHNSTDVAGFVGGQPVLDEESTAIYLSDTHKLTERLSVTAMGQAQLSDFVGGGPGYDGKEEDFFILQINFSYHFNPWLTAETGYNYSKLNSPLLNRAYTRDVMYLGFRAVY